MVLCAILAPSLNAFVNVQLHALGEHQLKSFLFNRQAFVFYKARQTIPVMTGCVYAYDYMHVHEWCVLALALI